MQEVIAQLGLDSSLFVQVAVFSILFFILRSIYFRPFMRLFEIRRQRTAEDREAAQRLLAQATERLDKYRNSLQTERLAARKEIEQMIAEARKEEAEILSKTREETKQIAQEANERARIQYEQVKKSLEQEVEKIAQTITDKLLPRKM